MSPPYLYFDDDHNRVEPDSNGVYHNATHCETNDWVNQNGTYLMIAFYVGSSMILSYGISYTIRTMMKYKKYLKQLEDLKKLKDTEFPKPSDNAGNEPSEDLPSADKSFGKWTFLMMAITIGVEVTAGVLMTTWQSKKLSITERDAINDADNYLTVQNMYNIF